MGFNVMYIKKHNKHVYVQHWHMNAVSGQQLYVVQKVCKYCKYELYAACHHVFLNKIRLNCLNQNSFSM